jgi:hypothetical protein
LCTNNPTTALVNSSTGNPAPTFVWASNPAAAFSSSAAAAPTVTFSGAGTYTITLVATSTSGSATASQVVVVQACSTPTSAFSIPSQICAKKSVTVTNTSTGSPSPTYNWAVVPSTSVIISNATAATPSFSFNAVGVYTVVLLSTNASGTSSATQLVNVNACPPNVAFSMSAAACLTTVVTTTNSTTSTITPISYSWSAQPSGNISNFTAPAPQITFTAAGIYTVTLLASNISGTASLSHTIDVQSPTIAVSSSTICSGNSFTISPSGASTYTYSSGSAVVNPIATTVYTVNGSSSQNCIATPVTLTITVNQTPTISVSNGTICSGNSFTITPSGASSYTYSSGSAVVNPLSTTIYTVSGSSNQNCNALPKTLTLTVNQTPTLSVNNASICVGTPANLVATGANTYSWSNGALTSSISVTPATTTIYTVTGLSNNCSKTQTVSVFVSPCTGVFELQSENSNVQLYPNPVKDQLTIVIHKSLIGKNYTITNTLGQQILKGTLINEQTTFVVQNLLQGLYQLNIDGINKNYKFIKE